MITDGFNKDAKPLMGPEDFYGAAKHLCDCCIVTFSNRIAEAVLQEFPHEKVGRIKDANGGRPIYLLEHEGKRYAFYLSRIGAALAATDLIDANHLTGVTQFVFFGSAGSLNEAETIGKYVLPTEAYRDEGMSYHYAAPSDYIKIRESDRLAEIFRDLDLPYVQSRVWTTDAFYMETQEKLKARQEEGCLAVEMEAAGVQAVCDYYGFSYYVFLMTGDVLDVQDYDIGTLWAVNHFTQNFHVALRIAERLNPPQA